MKKNNFIFILFVVMSILLFPSDAFAMQIKVNIPSSGENVWLEVEPSDEIYVVKQKVFEKKDIPIEDQALMFSDKILEDYRTLADYNIQKEETIILKKPFIILGDELLDDDISNNKSTTATYNNNTLTLNNYNGGSIKYYGSDNLKVVLKGNNVITSDYFIEGLYSLNSGLSFDGDGSLIIKNAGYGIKIDNGDLEINNCNISLNNIYEYGIYISNGSLYLYGNLSLDTNIDEIKLMDEYYIGYNGIKILNDFVIDGNLSIKNSKNGIISNGKILVVSGNIKINSKNVGLKSAKDFTMYGGDIDVNVLNDVNAFGIKYGMDITNKFNIYGGKIHISVPENESAIILYDDGVEPTINIDDEMEIIADNIKIINIDSKLTKSLGLSDNNPVNEVTIKDKDNYTYDIINEFTNKFIEKNIDKFIIKIDGKHILFKDLTIDNIELIKDIDYNVTNGSTIITFTNEGIKKLNTLSNGNYKIKVNYLNGETFNGNLILEKDIKEESKEAIIDNPKTFDNVSVYIISTIISILCLCGFIFIKKIRIKIGGGINE